MKGSSYFCLFLLCGFLFQNCGEFKSPEQRLTYPFSTKPDFFYDVKLVSVEEDEAGRQAYEFDVAVSLAEDQEQPVAVQLAFSTLDRVGVCPLFNATATGATKHQRHLCILPTPREIYVQMILVGPSEEQVTEQFRF